MFAGFVVPKGNFGFLGASRKRKSESVSRRSVKVVLVVDEKLHLPPPLLCASKPVAKTKTTATVTKIFMFVFISSLVVD
jgi:hypothetical protein